MDPAMKTHSYHTTAVRADGSRDERLIPAQTFALAGHRVTEHADGDALLADCLAAPRFVSIRRAAPIRPAPPPRDFEETVPVPWVTEDELAQHLPGIERHRRPGRMLAAAVVLLAAALALSKAVYMLAHWATTL